MKPDIYEGLKWGALIGGPLAILEPLLYLLALQENNAANFQVAECLFTPLEALLPFIAGFIASRQSSEVRSGWIAGLTFGLIVAAVNIVTTMLYPIPLDFLSTEGQPFTDTDMVFNWILARVVTIGFGIGFGWLGGQQAIRFMQPPDEGGR